MLIRAETPEDYIVIEKVNDLAFEQKVEGFLVKKLRMDAAFVPGLSLVAELDGSVIGHILFTKIEIEGAHASFDSLALAPMSVLPAHQSKGIGSALVNEGLKKAKGLGFKSVIVLGHQRYYPRFGFKPASQWNIKCPFPVPDAAFMGLELMPGALEKVSGTVIYAPPFSEV